MTQPPPPHRPTLAELTGAVPFAARHIGPGPEEQAKMLATLGYGSLSELVDAAVPDTIRDRTPLELPPAIGEAEVIDELRAMAGRNTVVTP